MEELAGFGFSPVTPRYSCSKVLNKLCIFTGTHANPTDIYTCRQPRPLSTPLLPTPPRRSLPPAAQLSAFLSGSKWARAPNGIQSPGGWLPLAGFKRGGEGRGCARPRRGRFRLLGITDGDLSRSQKCREGRRRIMQPHMSMRQMKGTGESTRSLNVGPEKWLK